MKKKLLFTLTLVALLVCIFAVSAGAVQFDSLFADDVTTYGNGPDWGNVDDKESTAVIKKANGDIVRVPAYYVFKANGNNQFAKDGSNFDFSFVKEKLGEEITLANLVAFEIPQGTTSIGGAISHSTFTALEELVIPSTVTALPSKLLRDNTIIKRVFVKQVKNQDGTVQGVTAIPDYFADMHTSGCVSSLEFFGCEQDYLTSIGSNAFLKSAIKEMRIVAPMTYIGGAAFNSCKSLTTLYIYNTSDTIISCGKQSYVGCDALTSVTFNGLSIAQYAFEKTYNNPGSLTFVATNVGVVEQGAFSSNENLGTVSISGPITAVGNTLFTGCKSLQNISIVNTLDARIKGVNNLCDGLKNLSSVTLKGMDIGNYAFRNTDGTEMKITLTGITSIGDEAFKNAENITELYIEGPLTYVGGSTYRECNKLKKLTVINTGDTLVSAGNGESNPMLEELKLVGKFYIGYPAFQNNTSLKHVYLGEGVEEIGKQAFFKCYALETAYLADTITSIADCAFDMDGSGKQTSTSFMFVDENGNMDNTLPTSLTFTGGHFLKGYTVANTQLIYPSGYTSAANSAYDFESAVLPQNFSIVFLGKMTTISYRKLYQHNYSKDVTIYLAKNNPSDINGERINVQIAENGAMSHSTYAGATTGTLEFVIDDSLHNNIKAAEHVKFVFCGSGEVCFVTRVNISREEGGAKSWGNFVSMPVTYEQFEKAYAVYNETVEVKKTVPALHPMLSAPVTSDATCTEPGGTKVYCLACGQIASIEKTADALGHNLDLEKGAILVSVEYTAYDQNGTKVISCAACHENCEATALAIFTVLGSSEKTFGDSVVAIGYVVDKAAIKELELTGVTFKYGVYAVAEEKLGGNEIFSENGVANGAFAKEITGYNNRAFELRLAGFTDAQKDIAFAMGAYVEVIENGEKKYSYLQLGDVTDGAKYSFVTYNQLIG